MNSNLDKNIDDIDRNSKKETYTESEKKMIIDRLNEERLIHQKAMERLEDKPVSQLTANEKQIILSRLNEKRLTSQKRVEIEKTRTHKKEIYQFGQKKFYKFLNMEREYFIEIVSLNKISSRPIIVSLYYRTFDELKKKDVLIKTEIYSEKFFISYDAVRVYFKTYVLEDEKRK